MKPRTCTAAFLSQALALVLALAATAGCEEQGRGGRHAVPGGDAARGAKAVAGHGCGTCHEIPGIAGANGMVGPSLAWMPRQVYVAGILPNTPDNLVRWLVDPPAVDPRTGMPDLDLSEAEARDIAAYLYEAGR